MRSPRTLLIGLDAGDLPFLRRHAADLPTLRRFLDAGVLHEPDSPRGLSGSVWPTFYTGAPPGEHGLYQHLVWNPETMGLRLIDPSWCRDRPFWVDLEERGRDVVVVDVPYSFGGHLRRGVEVMDWGTQGQTQPFYCNRPELARGILRRFGRGPIGRETPVHKNARQLERVRRRLIASAARKGTLSLHLMETLPWDVFLTVFGETHRGGHLLFGAEESGELSGDPLLDVYRAVDRAIAPLVDAAGPGATVLLLSVHGMTRDDNQAHLVRPLLHQLNRRFVREHLGRTTPDTERGGAVRRLRRAVPSTLQLAAGRIAPDALRQWVVERDMIGGHDWTRTPGFALRTDIRSELRLNLVGREARGLLEPGSALHRAYLRMLHDAVGGLRDLDTGELLIEDMIDVRAQHPGGRAEALPDFVLAWHRRSAARRVSAPGLGPFTAIPPAARGGDHTDLGFALVLGAGNRALPPLKQTRDFAAFITALAEAG